MDSGLAGLEHARRASDLNPLWLLSPEQRWVILGERSRLGIKKHLTPYAFRRWFNSLGVGTVPSEVLRKTVGHVSHEMTEHYLAVDLAGKRQLADGVAAKVFFSG